MKLRIIPYKRGSESAKLLAQCLGERLGYKVFRGVPKRRALNLSWGNKDFDGAEYPALNNCRAIHVASNKLLTFEYLEENGVSHVPYTASKEVAEGWLREGDTVFARTTGGQGGSGISVVLPGSPLPTQPLYTRYVKKKKEFRVHVVNGEVIDVQQKKKRNGVEATGLIRNLANGWIFAHEDVVEPTGLRELGVAAVQAVGLDFGAVDIIWNERQNRCFVLEVNTAPGLCPTTSTKYADAFVRHYGQA